MSNPRFPLGQVVATAGAASKLTQAQIRELLARHVAGDWGDLPPEDVQENELSLKEGFRILSAYKVDGVAYWVITEADRSVTTILLPEEY
jgi:hypothetical protein